MEFYFLRSRLHETIGVALIPAIDNKWQENLAAILHIGDSSNVPLPNVFVGCCIADEHSLRIGDICCVPLSNILIESPSVTQETYFSTKGG